MYGNLKNAHVEMISFSPTLSKNPARGYLDCPFVPHLPFWTWTVFVISFLHLSSSN